MNSSQVWLSFRPWGPRLCCHPLQTLIILTICTLDRCSGLVLDRDQEFCSFWPRSKDILTWVFFFGFWQEDGRMGRIKQTIPIFSPSLSRRECNNTKEIFDHCSLRKNYRSSMALASSVGTGRRLSTSGHRVEENIPPQYYAKPCVV